MEQKGFDSNFFIGMLLIFGILIWVNSMQIPNSEQLENTPLNTSSTISSQNSKVNNIASELYKNSSSELKFNQQDEKIYEYLKNQ